MTSKMIKKDYCVPCEDKKWNRKHKGVWEDHTYCFRCHNYEFGDNNVQQYYDIKNDFIGSFTDIRGISKEICEHLGILVGKIWNKEAIAYLYNKGVKIRLENKEFPWVAGKATDCSMFGLDQCIDYNVPLIITEGEFDCAALWEAGYQACSLHSGAASVECCFESDKAELLKYNEIWLGFDNDDPGKEATKKAIELLPLDKIKVLNWNKYKDANEALLDDYFNHRCLEFIEYKPEGIVLSKDVNIEELKVNNIKSLQIPLPLLNKSMGGFDYGCFYLVLAGVGIGKTTLLTWLGLQLFEQNNIKIASLFYEENAEVTPLRYIGLKHKIPVGKLRRDKTLLTETQWIESKGFLDHERMAFLNRKADRTSDGLYKYIKYLVQIKKFDVIIIDHLSYLIGRSGVSKNGERRDIDELIYNLQDLTQQLGCVIIAVSHVTESKNVKNWDEGEVPSVYSGRGSRALAQIPDGIIGLARNMRNEYNQSVMTVYNLKNRWGGTLGKMDSIIFFEDTGELIIK